MGNQAHGRLDPPCQWMLRYLQLQVHLQLERHLQLHLNLQTSPNPNRNNHHQYLPPIPKHTPRTNFIPT